MNEFHDVHNYLTRVKHLSPEDEEYGLESADFFFSFLPVINVSQTENEIVVGGFNAKGMPDDIERKWGTSRVAKALFNVVTNRRLSFFKFFGIEMIYIAHALLNDQSARSLRTSRSSLKKIQDDLFNNTWVGECDRRPPLNLNYDRIRREMSVTLLPTQENFLRSYAEMTPKLDLHGTIMAAPPGTGKTIAGFAFSLAVEADITIFVVPMNSLHDVWEKTLQTRFKKAPSYWISSQPGSPTGKERYVICHYQALDRIVNLVDKIQSKKVAIWLDESHNFNEIKSLRTQRFIYLCQTASADHVVWASGTPMKAIGSEAVPVLSTIDWLFTKEVAARFTAIFGTTVGRALDILSNRLSKLTFKIEKSDVVENKIQEQTLFIKVKNGDEFTLDAVRERVREFVEERIEHYKDMEKTIARTVDRILDEFVKTLDSEDLAEFKAYRQMIDQMHRNFDPRRDKDKITFCTRYEANSIYTVLTGEDKKDYRWAISRYKYIALVVRGEALGLVVTRYRIEANKAMVPEVPMKEIIDQAEKKTLIFTSYVEVADALADRATKLGFKPELVYGGTNKNLTAIIEKAKKDPHANPIIATYPSLSTAVPMVMCNVVWLFDTPFRDYIRNQAVSRVDRLDQDSVVRILNTFLDTKPQDNITTRSQEILKWAKDMVDSMMNFTTPDEASAADQESEQLGLESDWAEEDPFDMETLELMIQDEIGLESEGGWADLAFDDYHPLAYQNYWDEAWTAYRNQK